MLVRAGGLVWIWQTLGVLSLTVLVNSTGLLVSKAYQFLGDFHTLSLSMYYFFFSLLLVTFLHPRP